MKEPNFNEFENKIGITFNDKDLLRQAFTHRSYINENPGSSLSHNERLEFLGDAVLELVSTEFLFGKFADKSEGELTALRAALVNTVSLCEAATELRMSDFLLLSRGEAKGSSRARQSILADTFEAVIGAIYLDQGADAASDFITRNILYRIDTIIEKRLWQDSKSLFQEKAQEVYNITPEYKIISETGPDHNKRFTVGVYIGEDLTGEGTGLSKQEAEQEAALHGLEKKGWA